MENALNYRKISFSDIPNWIAHGWRMFRETRNASMAYAGIFAVIGAILLIGAITLNVAPMAFPLAGGFMLVGPVFLSGFFHVAALHTEQKPVRFTDFFLGFRHSPASLWAISLFCSLSGSVLAFMIFVISAFSVPLIFCRRVDLPKAVGASVRAIFGNFGVMIAWGSVLAILLGSTILLFIPLFVVAFPVLAYASEQACRDVCA